jgi:hypothetical protein
MMREARHVLVRTGPSGRTFGLGSLPGGGHVLDDLDQDTRLGEATADLNMFIVTIERSPHIVFAGAAEREIHEWTTRPRSRTGSG